MPEIQDLKPADASNIQRFPENMAPSAVNNGARALEGIIARWFFDTDSSLKATLSGSVIQVTTNRSSLTLTGTTSNYVANLVMGFTMGENPITGAASINIKSIGPISLRDNKGASLSSSFILPDQRCLIIKDGENDYFRLLYPDRSGLFTGTEAQVTAAAGDLVPIQDVSDSNNAKRATAQSIADLAPSATQTEQEAAASDIVFVTPLNQKWNPAAAKAWVNFQGTGTVGIQTSLNIASVTDVGTGDYLVNIATDFSGAGYAFAASAGMGADTGGPLYVEGPGSDANMAAGTFPITTFSTAAAAKDAQRVGVIFFGDQ